MPQGRPHFSFGSPYAWLSFTEALVFHSCTAVLSALDLTKPNASWETAHLTHPPHAGTSQAHAPCNHVLPSTPGGHLSHPALSDPACLQPQYVLEPKPGLPELDHGYEMPCTKPASLDASGSHSWVGLRRSPCVVLRRGGGTAVEAHPSSCP